MSNQISYTKKYPNFQAYWPETSEKAEHINEVAIKLFKNLFGKTALNKVRSSTNLMKDFIADSVSLSYHDLGNLLPVAAVSQCFRFSDYYVVCKDLGGFSKRSSRNEKYFTRKQHWKIQEGIGDILATLTQIYENLYLESLSLHPTEEIEMELQFLYSLSRRENSGLIEKSIFENSDTIEDDTVDLHSKNPPEHNFNQYEILLNLGTILNESYLHTDAITTLSKAIEIEKYKVDAYIERAHAYFELNQLDLALKDFEKIKHIKNKQKSLQHNHHSVNDSDSLFVSLLESEEHDGDLYYLLNGYDDDNVELYAKSWQSHYILGFCLGAKRGAVDAAVDYVPNTLSCCRGILHGIWSFAKNPKGGTEKLLEASYYLVEKLRKDTLRDHLEVIVPELKELFLKWDSLNSYDKGEKVGYIIGRYGIDIFIPLVTIKTINHFLIIKRANTLATLKTCKTKVDGAKILEQSASHAKARQVLWSSAKSGKMIPQDGNKIPHIMQKKHGWDKIIKLSGNQVEDFKKVAILLEQNKVLSQAQYIETVKTGIKIMRCETKIQGHIVEARFIQYETGEVFLTNAYVKTR